jgi:Pyruvate/2-oxoacid:ferredoxin oxidoreductase gamma subunit
VFPLGVKKDVAAAAEPWFELPERDFDPRTLLEVLGADRHAPPRFADGFPAHLDPRDVAIKLAGAGGDGAQTLAMLTAKLAIDEGFDATYIPSYGPESRGGTSYADVHVATEEVLSPACPEPHVLLAFNAPSLEKFGPTVRDGGLVLYDSTMAPEPPKLPGRTLLGLPFGDVARALGTPRAKNMVAWGALQVASRLFPMESFLFALRQALGEGSELAKLNERAFREGMEAAAAVLEGRVEEAPVTV